MVVSQFLPVDTQGSAAKNNLIGIVSACSDWQRPEVSVSDILQNPSDWPIIIRSQT